MVAILSEASPAMDTRLPVLPVPALQAKAVFELSAPLLSRWTLPLSIEDGGATMWDSRNLGNGTPFSWVNLYESPVIQLNDIYNRKLK